MKTAFRSFAFFALVFALMAFAFPAQAFAANTVIESARAHGATGALGCTVSGATVATPSVVTCAAAHNLIDGDQVQITGVGGTTTINTTAYVKVTTYSTTTFGLFSDAALSTGVTGTGSYTSGGVVTKAQDISTTPGFATTQDFTVRLKVEGLTAAKNAAVCIQDSADGFVSDIVTLACVNLSGAITSGTPATFSFRKYQLPSLRVGVSSARLRLNVTQIDGSATVTTSLSVIQ